MRKNDNPATAAVVYHKADFDGICSYAILRIALEAHGFKVTPLPWNHGDDVPCTAGYDTVAVADCCLPNYEMLALNRENRLLWIDHHATSIRESQEAGFCVAPGVRTTRTAACALCWEQFKEFIPHLDLGELVRILAAYDTYDKEAFPWDEVTLPLQFGLRNIYGLDAEAFFQDFRAGFPGTENADYRQDILREGKAVLRYLRTSGRQAAEKSGFEILLAGQVKALCLLTTTCFSLPYEESARERGCQAVVCISRSQDGSFRVSAYSADGTCPMDLGQYMKEHYQGGGHHDAAGGVLSEKQFLALLYHKVL